MALAIGRRCAACREYKALVEFSTRSQNGKKYPLSYCKPCKAKREKEARLSDVNAHRAYKRAYYEKNKIVLRDKAKAERAKNPSYFNTRTAAWKKENHAVVSQYRKTYAKKNRHKFLYYNSNRRASKKMARPSWANLDEIKRIYQDAAVCGVDVDHIVPLTSKIVCGLHVENNLQLLEKKENRSKGNRLWPDMP